MLKGAYRNIVKPTLVLCIICVVISGLLAFTYQAAGIASLGTGLSQSDLDEAKPFVMPAASKLVHTKASVDDEYFLGAYTDEGGQGTAVFFIADGYHGKESMKLLVGFDNNGAVTGIYPTESAETPGVGSKALTPEYLANFIGASAPITVDKAGGSADVDAISGATITSKAVGDAVNHAIELYNAVKGEIE